jgi:hypothetical protein
VFVSFCLITILFVCLLFDHERVCFFK